MYFRWYCIDCRAKPFEVSRHPDIIHIFGKLVCRPFLFPIKCGKAEYFDVVISLFRKGMSDNTLQGAKMQSSAVNLEWRPGKIKVISKNISAGTTIISAV